MRNPVFVLSSCLIAASACSTAASTSRPLTASAACGKLGDTTQAVSTLFTSGNLYGAGTATDHGFFGQGAPEPYPVGAELYVHATPGVTAEYLQRTLECYTESGRSLHPSDPFHPAKGYVVRVRVLSSGDSFTVRLVGSDSESAQDIRERASALAASVRAEQVAEQEPQHSL